MNSPRLRVIIVDDEALARQLIREYLASHTDISVIEECANGFEAVKAITEIHPDLVFLDIQMPKLSGFEVLELTQRKHGVIFTTAYDQYALKAFEVHALDYLLKPFSRERFDAALAHARQHIQDAITWEVPSSLMSDKKTERILIRDGVQVHVIPVTQIDYIEAQDDYIAIYTAGKCYLKTQTLADIEKQLDPSRFVRIHRSYIVHVERIARIELYAKDSRTAILRDGKQIPISRSGYDHIKQLL